MSINSRAEQLNAIEKLLDIMDELRLKCPWDKEQTFESLRNLTIEETYELADAIMNKDDTGIKKELGDLLLHVIFYAKIGSEEGIFDIADIANSLSEKLIFRHPHVFGDIKVNNSNEVKENWEEIKLKEKSNHSVLGGVPVNLPAMIKANRVQEKVRAVGFDWEQPGHIWKKIEEEINELAQEIKKGEKDKIEGEFGDLLFSVINAARLYGIDPETALEKTNLKFIKRFKYLEEKIRQQGKSIKEMNLEEMDKIWEESKKFDKS